MKRLKKPLIAGVILILTYTYFNNPGSISTIFKNIFSVFSIFIYGGLIAFLLNPLLIFLEKKIKIKRQYIILGLFLTVILLLSLFFYFIIPSLASNITDFVKNYPEYIDIMESFVKKHSKLFPMIKDLNISKELLILQEKFMNYIQKEYGFLIGQFLGATAKIMNLIISLIFSVFFLGSKEYFCNLSIEVLKTFLPKSELSKIIDFTARVERVFLGYLSGKLLDSLIIGGLAIIGLFFLKVPYVFLLGILITILNFIPYIGPLIGIMVSVIITLFTIPSNVIFVFIFLLILQQFDAWVLEPRILGNKLNLSMFWTIAAVTFGGGLFGALGIIIAIPGFALIKELYLKKLKENKSNK